MSDPFGCDCQCGGPCIRISACKVNLVLEDQRLEFEAQMYELRERLKDYKDAHRNTVEDCGAADEKHCSCVPALRLEIERLRAFIEVESKAREGREALLQENERLRGERDRLAGSLAVCGVVAREGNGAVLPEYETDSLTAVRKQHDEIERLRAMLAASAAESDRLRGWLFSADAAMKERPCGRNPCHRGADGYCAKCHQEMQP